MATASVSYTQLIQGNQNFRLLWGGQIVSQLGDWFSAITIQALLLKYTGSATSLFWFMVATMLPGLLLGPVVGVVVDHLPRKSVMIGADIGRAVIALGLLGLRGPETVWIAYLCVAGLSSFAAFFEPARISTLPNITSEEELVTANALTSVTWSVLLTSGALAGGIVATLFGAQTAFVLNSLSFIGSALLLGRMAVPPTNRGPEHTDGFGELIGGFRYVRHRPEILGALTAKMGWGLAGGIQTLIPIYGARLFPLPHDRDGQLSISLLFAAGGLGTALGPVFARRFTGRDLTRIRWAIALSFLAGAVYYGCMAGAPGLGTAALFLLLARMHGAVIWVFSTVLLQLLAEDRFRGRVFAAETSLFTGAMMLSSLATTRALDSHRATVPQVTLTLAAVSFLVGIVWIGRLIRRPEPPPCATACQPPGGHGAPVMEPENEKAVG
jgi:MFS family permease